MERFVLFAHYYTDTATMTLCYDQNERAGVKLTHFWSSGFFRCGMAAGSSVFIGLCEYPSLGLWEGQRSCSTLLGHRLSCRRDKQNVFSFIFTVQTRE